MSKSFDDFVKQQQQQQQKPRGFGYQYGYGSGSPGFQYLGQLFVPQGQVDSFPNSQFGSQASLYVNTPADSRLNTPGPMDLTLLLALTVLKLKIDVPFTDELDEIFNATKIGDVKKPVDLIVAQTEARGLHVLEEWKFTDVLKMLFKQKNPVVRELGLLLIQQLARKFGGNTPQEAYLVPLLGSALDMFADKDKNVVKAAKQAVDSLYGVFPVEALATVVIDAVLSFLGGLAKWNLKLAALDVIDRLVEDVPADLLEMQFIHAVPVLTDLATDFKPELAKHGLKLTKQFVKVLDNLDLVNKYDLIVETLANPSKIPECIKNLSLVTFVAEMTEPALSLLTPILEKSLKMSLSSNDQLRQTVMVTENLTRLVNNKREIEPFIGVLMPGVEKVVNHASLPEVRDLAEKALVVLKEAEAAEGTFAGRITADEAREYVPSGHDETESRYLATVIAADANVNDWTRLTEYLGLVGVDADTVLLTIATIRSKFDAVVQQEELGENEVEIVNTDFSLAYGTRMLLNKTTLRLLKGHRYGLCGRNGAGKSTLMRAILKGQLEGFPAPDELKTCFVEHKLQGLEADMDLVSFIASDPELSGSTQEEIRQALLDVGFPEDRVTNQVGSLSGGWKMKLELARAMLLQADILLLDEPTNHLDVKNVQWLQDYLITHTDITSLIVSHDLGFLDAVCTDIIHYENKKLAYYKGNLLDFVKVKPEGKSYYTLTDSNVQMHFPLPGLLAGVKLNTRLVARMNDVTFSYPGAEKPSLKNVLCLLSLSLRVAVLGPNGAGKSTLIKLLTGETVPDLGTVEKHPNLRIGYIAQHALEHVEQHKEKTANQYLQWRYQFGDDREVLLKQSRKISEEEKEQMAKEIDIGDGRGARQIEAIVGRQKLKKSFQYEVKWKFWLPKYNSWVPRDVLVEHGFEKLVQKFDDHEALREGLGYRELVPLVIRKHFEDVGLDGDIADHTPMGLLSGGQLVKVVIAGCTWQKPHVMVLDEPTNYLDRDSLGGLAMAIREFKGGVVLISHNSEFSSALCPEQWHIDNGELVLKGHVEVALDAFEDGGNSEQAAAAAAAAAAASTTKTDDASPANIKVKQRKKKMTRNEKKAQAERRRLRYIDWLNSPKGTPKPVDTDDEDE